MKTGTSGVVHALEFGCQAPLRFYEHCASCSKSRDDCPDLALGKEILRGKKKLVYNETNPSEDTVFAGAFTCLAPLQYFDRTRKTCGHQGRCREEGLLLALLVGKKTLDYALATPARLPRRLAPQREAVAHEAVAQEA